MPYKTGELSLIHGTNIKVNEKTDSTELSSGPSHMPVAYLPTHNLKI